MSTRGFRFPLRESKFFDIAPANYAFNTTGSVACICTPVPGTDYTNRIGRKIVIKSVYIRGQAVLEAALNNPGALNDKAQLGRVILLWDMQPNGALPAVTDVLLTADSRSHLNPNNRDRFKVIWDKQWAFGSMYVDTTATQAVSFASGLINAPVKYFKKLRQEVIFNAGSAGTVADINSGALILLTIGTQAAGTNTDADLGVGIRVRFDDQ